MASRLTEKKTGVTVTSARPTNLVQHLQLRCPEDRFLIPQTRKRALLKHSQFSTSFPAVSSEKNALNALLVSLLLVSNHNPLFPVAAHP